MQQKLPQALLSQYFKWLVDKQQSEGVCSLRDFVVEEATTLTKAAETLYGVEDDKPRRSPAGKVMYTSTPASKTASGPSAGTKSTVPLTWLVEVC